jgi:hypothetical protein
LDIDFDTDDEFRTALEHYENQRFQKLQAQQQQQAAVDAHKREMETVVNRHYERAAKLIEQHKLSPDVYKQADTRVRNALESVKPGMGDVLTDQLIKIAGDASEKVMYNLGINQTALNELQSRLINDPSGLSAAAYIGEKRAQLLQPAKLKSTASKPAKKVTGGVGGPSSTSLKYQNDYKKAQKNDDAQAAYNIRKKAKQEGIDVSSW